MGIECLVKRLSEQPTSDKCLGVIVRSRMHIYVHQHLQIQKHTYTRSSMHELYLR